MKFKLESKTKSQFVRLVISIIETKFQPQIRTRRRCLMTHKNYHMVALARNLDTFLLWSKTQHMSCRWAWNSFCCLFVCALVIAPLKARYSEALPTAERTLHRSFMPKRLAIASEGLATWDGFEPLPLRQLWKLTDNMQTQNFDTSLCQHRNFQ